MELTTLVRYSISTSSMHKFLAMATKEALAHTYDTDLEYSLCAVIVKSGRPVSVGFNNRSTNGFVEYYATSLRGIRDYCLSTHAEMDAVLRARNTLDLSGTKIYVSRILKKGGVGLSRPCPICQSILYNYGIRRAYYTINDNEYGVMRITKNSSEITDKVVQSDDLD